MVSSAPATMPVVACRAGGGVRLEERPVPQPGPGEIVLDLIVCGLCGTDLFKLVNATEAEGTVLGHELVGRVSAVGAGAAFAEGERVVVPHHVACGECHLCRSGSHTQCSVFKENLLDPGGFCDKVLVRERAARRAAWRVPDAVPDAAATFLEPAACVLRGVDRSGLTNDGCVLVIGAGSMGLLHLLVLRALYPDLRVVVSDPVEDRRRLALQLGATAAVGIVGDEILDAVSTTSDGADAVFDTVGGAKILGPSLGLLRDGGTVVLFAHAGHGEEAGFDLNVFFKREQRVVATYSGSLDEQQRIAELLFEGRLDPMPLVSHTLPLSDFSVAVELARSLRGMKIMLEPDR